MVHVVAQCHEEGLEHYLRSYVKVQCNPTIASDVLYVLVHIKIFFSLSTLSLSLNLSLIPPPMSKRSMKSWLKQ